MFFIVICLLIGVLFIGIILGAIINKLMFKTTILNIVDEDIRCLERKVSTDVDNIFAEFLLKLSNKTLDYSEARVAFSKIYSLLSNSKYEDSIMEVFTKLKCILEKLCLNDEHKLYLTLGEILGFLTLYCDIQRNNRKFEEISSLFDNQHIALETLLVIANEKHSTTQSLYKKIHSDINTIDNAIKLLKSNGLINSYSLYDGYFYKLTSDADIFMHKLEQTLKFFSTYVR